MKSLYVVFGAAVSALTMAACAVDDPPASSDDPADEAVAPDGIAKIITVPPELTVSRLGETIEDNHTCHVTLVSCADPRFRPCLPSFYQNGGCSYDRMVCEAYWQCVAACGINNCNVLLQLPDGGSC